MSDPGRSGRMPRETPEWTGDAPLDEWPRRADAHEPREQPVQPDDPAGEDTEEPLGEALVADEDEDEDEAEPELPVAPEPELELEEAPEDDAALEERAHAEHAAGEIEVPAGYAVIEGYPAGQRRAVAVVVARFNGEITNRMLAAALDELTGAGVGAERVTVMAVPGAFELPLAAMALAKTRRYSCIIALGCVIRGETPHFDYVAGESASGLQLAAIETGVPVAFGVLTCDTLAQAEARVAKGAEAVRTGLEMADVFAQLRASTRA